MRDQSTTMTAIGNALRERINVIGTKSGKDATLLRQEYRRVWAAKFRALRCEQDDDERLKLLAEWIREPANDYERAWCEHIAPMVHSVSVGGAILDIGAMRFALVPIDKL